jgi:putative tryptophan/tyrosine transport system substrate-binding protein
MRRTAVLAGVPADDPGAQMRYAALVERLRQLGWLDGRNVDIDIRWSAGNAADRRKFASELEPVFS